MHGAFNSRRQVFHKMFQTFRLKVIKMLEKMMQKKFPSSKRNDRMLNDVFRKNDKMAHQVVIVRFYIFILFKHQRQRAQTTSMPVKSSTIMQYAC